MKLKFFPKKESSGMVNLMKYRKIWYAISLLIIIPGILATAVWGLEPSIDFTGGSKLEIEGTSDVEKAKSFAEKNGLENVTIQKTGESGLSLRFKEVDEAKHNEVKNKLPELGNDVRETSFETVGPTVSKELTKNAFILITIASAIIIFYIAYSFRRVPKPANSWEFGFSAIAALIHDVLITIGAFSLLGRFRGIEIDPLFITAILTIISFSVHDTIVILDRIRENLIKKGSDDFEGIVNLSLIEMLPRTINTTFMTWAVLLILLMFGGVTIRNFTLALVIGMFSGTYSSVFTSAPLLITWQEFKKNRSK